MGEIQQSLFSEYPELHELPQDVQSDIAILTGQARDLFRAGTERGQDPYALESLAPKNAQERLQDRMLKKHELKNQITYWKDTQIFALDLALPEDSKKLEDLYNIIGENPGVYSWDETPKKMVIDNDAPRGFRCMMTITLYKMDQKLNPASSPPVFDRVGAPPQPAAPIAPKRTTIGLVDGGQIEITGSKQG